MATAAIKKPEDEHISGACNAAGHFTGCGGVTFSYPDYTVGAEISPAPANRTVAASSRALTAGRELHRHTPALTLPRRSIYSVGQLQFIIPLI
jgi:hypothetical protein